MANQTTGQPPVGGPGVRQHRFGKWAFVIALLVLAALLVWIAGLLFLGDTKTTKTRSSGVRVTAPAKAVGDHWEEISSRLEKIDSHLVEVNGRLEEIQIGTGARVVELNGHPEKVQAPANDSTKSQTSETERAEILKRIAEANKRADLSVGVLKPSLDDAKKVVAKIEAAGMTPSKGSMESIADLEQKVNRIEVEREETLAPLRQKLQGLQVDVKKLETRQDGLERRVEILEKSQSAAGKPTAVELSAADAVRDAPKKLSNQTPVQQPETEKERILTSGKARVIAVDKANPSRTFNTGVATNYTYIEKNGHTYTRVMWPKKEGGFAPIDFPDNLYTVGILK